MKNKKLLVKLTPNIEFKPVHQALEYLKDLNKAKLREVDYNRIEKLPDECYKENREQYDAICLSNHVYRSSKELVLTVIEHDMYAMNRDFIFGIAFPEKMTIISTLRLEEDTGVIKKEILHQLGHVLGLGHCTLPCVMTLSKTVAEARKKDPVYCKKCQHRISSL